MSAPADNSVVFLPGPWQHRLINANGCQFHIAHMGEHRNDRPLVLLVHGFPEYWWAWRHQIEAIALAGYEVAAIDQRGIGGSDKTPDSADGMLLTEDLAAIVRSLGTSKAVVIGQGRGGFLAWSVAAFEPDVVEGIMTISAPHPRTLQRFGTHLTLKTWRQVLATLIPHHASKRLTDEKELNTLLADWSAPGNTGASGQVSNYAAAMRLPEAASISLEQLRWSYLSTSKINGRKHMVLTRREIKATVWAVRGERDPLLPARAWRKDLEFARGNYRFIEVPAAGHFVQEEQPELMTNLILEFLNKL